MAQLPSDNLFELAERKLQLLEQLQRLSADQAMLVNDQRVEELLCLLARKSEIVEALQSVQQQLQPFADQAPELREWQSPEKRQACRKVFDQINDRLRQLLMIDDYALNTLVQQREIVAGQISQIATADVVAHAYQSNLTTLETSSMDSLNLEG